MNIYHRDTMKNDKLLDVSGHANKEEWNMCCPKCQSKNLDISPLDEVYRQHTVNTFDDLPKEVRDYYKNLRPITQTIMDLINSNHNHKILVHCNECGNNTRGFWNDNPDFTGTNYAVVYKNKKKFREYIEKYYGVKSFMVLEGKEDDV